MSKRANGEGTIYKRKDGRWTARLSLPGGKRKDFFGKKRSEVASKLATATKNLHDGLPIPSDRETVGRFLERWLETVSQSVRPRTWRRYEQYVRIHAIPEIGRVTLSRLGPTHLQRLYSSRLKSGLSPTTVRHLHTVLHGAFRQVARWGLVIRNPVDLVDGPRMVRREMHTLSTGEAQMLLASAIGDRLHALYVVALTTGMRQGEILALRWQDLDLERGSFQVRGSMQRTPQGLVVAETKTAHSRRQVVLTQIALEAPRRHRLSQAEERLHLGEGWEDKGLVFANELGRPIEAGNLLRRSFWPLLKRAGLPRIRFHDLRHTAATLMLAQDVNAKVVAEMLGHARISTTLDLYSHVSPTMQRQAADALDAVLRA